MTIYAALKARLGRTPTSAELRADVDRIKTTALVELATKGSFAINGAAERDNDNDNDPCRNHQRLRQ